MANIINNSYYNDNIYDKIINFLGLPIGSERIYWDIDDHIEGTEIYLLHYNSEKIDELIYRNDHTPIYSKAECDALLLLRGLIIDLDEKWICCRSFGFTNTSNNEKLELNQDGTLSVTDLYGNVHSGKNFSLQTFYGGTIIRIWKYKGKVYFSTHHKISANNSKWGTSKMFEELFFSLFPISSTSDEDKRKRIEEYLFPNFTKETANYCHVFILTVPEIVSGIRFPIGKGYLVYLRTINLNYFVDEEAPKHYKYYKNIDFDYKFISKELDSKIKRLNVKIETKNDIPIPPISISTNFIITPSTFNLTVANKILLSGYNDLSEEDANSINPHLRPGESIIIDFGFPSKTLIKINPISANWRNKLLNNDPNIFHQYCKLLNYANPLKEKYVNKQQEDIFPIIGYPNDNELKNISLEILNGNLRPEYIEDDSKPSQISSINKNKVREGKRKNISYCMLYVVPYHMIEKAGSFYKIYKDDLEIVKNEIRTNVANLGNAVNKGTLLEDQRFSSNMKDNKKKLNTAGKVITRIMTEAANYLEVRRRDHHDIRNGKKMSDKEIVIDNINKLLNNENGEGVYALFKAFNTPGFMELQGKDTSEE